MPSSPPRSRSPLTIPPGVDVFEDEINYFAGNLELLNDTAVQPYPTTLKNGRRLNILLELIEQRAPHLMG